MEAIRLSELLVTTGYTTSQPTRIRSAFVFSSFIGFICLVGLFVWLAAGEKCEDGG
jgi:hypothetical protein